MSVNSTAGLLRRLARGEILERQAKTYFVRGERVLARLANNLIRLEFVEPPPNLFTPNGGQITDAGRAELQNLEQTNVR